MDRVEGGDEVELGGAPELGGVAAHEAHVGERELARLGAARLDRVGRGVAADEAAARELGGQSVQRAAGPAADVEHVDAARERVAEPGDERQDLLDQLRDDGLVALLRHHAGEALVGRVRHAAAALEALEDLLLDRPQQRNPLTARRHVVRTSRAGQQRGVLGRQRVGVVDRPVLDETAGHHRAEPLAHVARVESRLARDLGGARRPRTGS